MSSLLLFYAFDYTLLFLTMDRYPFVDLALLTTSLHWIWMGMWMEMCVLSPSLGEDLGREFHLCPHDGMKGQDCLVVGVGMNCDTRWYVMGHGDGMGRWQAQHGTGWG